jgi:hypothetical protein
MLRMLVCLFKIITVCAETINEGEYVHSPLLLYDVLYAMPISDISGYQ